MGSNKEIHLGIYVKIPKKTGFEVVSYYVNSKNQKVDSKFNSETGEEHRLISETVTKTIQPSPYIDDENVSLDYDMFWSPAYMPNDDKEAIFLPNIGNGYDFEDVAEVSLSDIDIKYKILMFKRKYRRYLDYYIEKYGNIEVDYGVIVYFH